MVSSGAVGATTEGLALSITVAKVCEPVIPFKSVASMVVYHVPALVYAPFANPPSSSVTQVIVQVPQSDVSVVNNAVLNVLTVTEKEPEAPEPSITSTIEKVITPSELADTVKGIVPVAPSARVNVELSKLNSPSVDATTNVAATPVFCTVTVPLADEPAL